MNILACERELGEALRTPLFRLGFAKSDVAFFSRSSPIGEDRLRFGGRLDDGRCLISGSAGVFLSRVEAILRSDPRTATQPTIVMPLHFLHEGREFFEWTMETNSAAIRVAEEIEVEVRTYALPFFDAYSKIENVRLSLESSNPRDWFALTPEQRIILLVAIEYTGGNREKAKKIIDEAIAARADEPPKRRQSLEKLRARLEQAAV